MKALPCFEFATRRRGPRNNPWSVFRFYCEARAYEKHRELCARKDLEVREMVRTNVQDGYILLFADNVPFVEIDTTGLVRAASVARHRSTGTKVADVLCREGDLGAVKAHLDLLNRGSEFSVQ